MPDYPTPPPIVNNPLELYQYFSKEGRAGRQRGERQAAQNEGWLNDLAADMQARPDLYAGAINPAAIAPLNTSAQTLVGRATATDIPKRTEIADQGLDVDRDRNAIARENLAMDERKLEAGAEAQRNDAILKVLPYLPQEVKEALGAVTLSRMEPEYGEKVKQTVADQKAYQSAVAKDYGRKGALSEEEAAIVEKLEPGALAKVAAQTQTSSTQYAPSQFGQDLSNLNQLLKENPAPSLSVPLGVGTGRIPDLGPIPDRPGPFQQLYEYFRGKPIPAKPAAKPQASAPSPAGEGVATAYWPGPVSQAGQHGLSGTMEGGDLDRFGNKIWGNTTMEDYLEGRGKYVTVAMDPALANGQYYESPQFPGIPFRAMDTGGAFKGKGNTRFDIAFRDPNKAKTFKQPITMNPKQ